MRSNIIKCIDNILEIRQISASKGYDPAAHVLVAFGGAAFQVLFRAPGSKFALARFDRERREPTHPARGGVVHLGPRTTPAARSH